MAKQSSTKEQILKAAQTIFQEKGFKGATLREIADKAGVNKGSIHYYFKTKRRLFEAIFSVVFNQFHSRIQTMLEASMPLEKKIDLIVEQSMDLLLKNPDLPRFVLHELHTSPDLFSAKELVRSQGGTTFSKFQQIVEQEKKESKVASIDTRHLLINLLSMIAFPFIGRPMIQLTFGIDDKEFEQFLHERKAHIKFFVLKALQP